MCCIRDLQMGRGFNFDIKFIDDKKYLVYTICGQLMFNFINIKEFKYNGIIQLIKDEEENE